jgi:hypothetical protein
VVILIDEYDKPILDHLDNTKRALAQRKVLKSFYDALKSLDASMRAVFITGVSKFSKTSIFSGLNNLEDISDDPEVATLLGYTESEIKDYFPEYKQQIARANNLSDNQLMLRIKDWYNGYQFSKEPVKVYNPFSLVRLFDKKEFKNYWFESGTPTFLVELLKKNPDELQHIEQKAFTTRALGTFDIEDIHLATLLYQTGYLTIADYDEQYKMYKLTFPNQEVRESLSILEMGVLTYKKTEIVEADVYSIKQALDHKDLETFFIALRSLFAGIPHHIHLNNEAYYHSLFHVLVNALGVNTQSEIATSIGRIDLTLITQKYIYTGLPQTAERSDQI